MKHYYLPYLFFASTALGAVPHLVIDKPLYSMKTSDEPLEAFLEQDTDVFIRDNSSGQPQLLSFRGLPPKATDIYLEGVKVNSAMDGAMDMGSLSTSSLTYSYQTPENLLNKSLGATLEMETPLPTEGHTYEAGFSARSPFSWDSMVKIGHLGDTTSSTLIIENTDDRGIPRYQKKPLYGIKNPYKKESIAGVIQHHINKDLVLETRLRHMTSDLDTNLEKDPNLPKDDHVSSALTVGSLKAIWTPSNQVHTIALGGLQDRKRYDYKNQFDETLQTERVQVSYKGYMPLDANQNITIRLEHDESALKAHKKNERLKKHRAHTTTADMLYQVRVDAITLEGMGGLAHNHKTLPYYGAKAIWDMTNKFSLTTVYKRTVRFETLYERYGYLPYMLASKEIKPEKAYNYELIGSYRDQRFSTEATLFKTHVRDFIHAQEVEKWLYRSKNVHALKTQGISFKLGWMITPTIETKVGYTYTDTSSKELGPLYYPRHRVTHLLVWKPAEAMEVQNQLTYASHTRSAFDHKYYGGTLLWDIDITYKPDATQTYFVGLHNILNKHQQARPDWASLGRSIQAGVKISF